MGLYQSLSGTVRVKLTSAAAEDSLARISAMGIVVYRVVQDGALSVVFRVSRRDLKRLEDLVRRRGEELSVVESSGLYWTIRSLLGRPVLLFGLCLLLFLVWFVPSRVLWIQVEGNTTIPKQQILEAARESGIYFGASRRQVRSEKVKNRLLGSVPNLQWAGVNTYGCRAVISVRERAETEQTEAPFRVSSIVASRDGMVVSVTVTAGNGLCVTGQAVQKGDVLISAFTDCGRTIRAERASGEIVAQTNRNLKVLTPDSRLSRGQKTGQTRKYALRLGKKRINFYKGSGISGSSCVKISREYTLTLPGGAVLPVALIQETVTEFTDFVSEVPEVEMQQMLAAFAQQYLKNQMIAGTILYQTESVTRQQGAITLTGSYACTEMIGRERPEKNGEYHGKTN